MAFIDYKEKDGVPTEYSIHCLTPRQIRFLHAGLISGFLSINSLSREGEANIYQIRQEVNTLIQMFEILKTRFMINTLESVVFIHENGTRTNEYKHDYRTLELIFQDGKRMNFETAKKDFYLNGYRFYEIDGCKFSMA